MISQLESDNFLESFREYNAQIYAYAYARLGQDRALAEDIAQEVFVRAWENRHKFDASKSQLKTWLFTIARHLLIDHWRKHKPEPFRSEELEKLPSKSNVLENEVLKFYIYQALSRLSPDEQDLIVWRYIQGLEIREIAAILEKDYGAVKVACHRALQKLKAFANEKE